MNPIMSYIQLRNSEGKEKAVTRLKEAFTTVTGAGPLVRDQWRDAITNTLHWFSPIWQFIKTKGPLKTNRYRWNLKTGSPPLARHGSETSETRTGRPNYDEAEVKMKDYKFIGEIKDETEEFAGMARDPKALQLEDHVQAHQESLAHDLIYGCNGADKLQPDGLDALLVTPANRLSQFASGSGLPQTPGDVSLLRKMRSYNVRKGGDKHPRAYIMSPEMEQTFANTLENVYYPMGPAVSPARDGLSVMQLAMGWHAITFDGIPIISSTQMGGVEAGTMPAITLSQESTGGSLPESTQFWIYVTRIGKFGESMAATGTITIAAGTATNRIKITFTGSEDYTLYKVYMSPANGVPTGPGPHQNLLKLEVAAQNYDSSDTWLSSVTDIYVDQATPTDAVTGRENDIPPTAGAESIMLWDFDEFQGFGEFVFTHVKSARLDGLISLVEFAKTEFNTRIGLRTTGTMVPSYPDTSVIVRGVVPEA